jgi:parkin
LGTQSVLHAVKTRPRIRSEIKSKKCLETLYDEESDIPSKPLSSTLVDLQLTGDERKNSESSIRHKANFFIHCPDCKKLCKGKLRVRCNICKGGCFTVHRDPECWDDVLINKRITGHCESKEIACTSDEDHELPFAEFYFKCAEHPSTEKDYAAPLNLIKTNIKEVPCLSCGDVFDTVLVFPCSSGHTICLDCFKLYCTSRLQERQFVSHETYGYTLTCPVLCENSYIEEIHHFKLLPNNEYERYQQFGAEESLIQAGGVLCPQPNCGNGYIVDETCNKVHCVNGCGFVFCKICKQGYHIGDCITESSSTHNSSANEYSINLNRAAVSRWDEASRIVIQVTTKPCPKCRTPTERSGGCMHMVCTRAGCAYEWCWICQTEWTRDCMGEHWFG